MFTDSASLLDDVTLSDLISNHSNHQQGTEFALQEVSCDRVSREEYLSS